MSTSYVATSQYRYLRACMVCSLVQTHQKFVKDGCPNCDEILQYRGSPERVDECTSPVFEGLITLREPTRSWVAKWQRIDGFVKGIYAVKVTGNLPEEVLQTLSQNGIEHHTRDGTDTIGE